MKEHSESRKKIKSTHDLCQKWTRNYKSFTVDDIVNGGTYEMKPDVFMDLSKRDMCIQMKFTKLLAIGKSLRAHYGYLYIQMRAVQLNRQGLEEIICLSLSL